MPCTKAKLSQTPPGVFAVLANEKNVPFLNGLARYLTKQKAILSVCLSARPILRLSARKFYPESFTRCAANFSAIFRGVSDETAARFLSTDKSSENGNSNAATRRERFMSKSCPKSRQSSLSLSKTLNIGVGEES